MAYSRDDIDKVRQATDLVELVGAVTKVKRSGRSYMAICPFHQEKSPSLSLDPARGLYHCFGCQKGGDVFTFLGETQGLDFNEAVEELARRAGIQLESDPGADRRRGRRNALHEAVRRAIEVYHRILKDSPEAGPARAYLRGRGYDADVVDEYRIGYAPDGWETLVKELRAAGVAERTMIDAGLARRGRGGRLYDYFRGRVMFPIHDLRGDPAGFGGRALDGGGAKYINSPDSPIYNKARLLYGLDRARTAIARAGRSVIVEGYTDVIALHRSGVAEAVATCGTALTDDHFDLLRRFADRVVLAFDADEAGTEAARRTSELEAPVRLDLDMRVAVMPDGGDPADIVQAGRVDEVVAAIEDARPLFQFRLEREVEDLDLTEPEGRARALHSAASQLAKVGDPIVRREYERFVSKLVGVDLEDVDRAVESRRRPEPRPGRSQRRRSNPRRRLESEILRLMISGGEGTGELTAEIFSEPDLREAARILEAARAGEEAVDITRLDVGEDVRSLLMAHAVQGAPDARDHLLARARAMRIDAEIDRLEAVVAATDPSDEGYSQAFNRLIALQREKRNT
ncbi:MAG TPA: DNA primase [Acidimicrobiia bacterium]|nr:DNA primase [Acidimicrobiia bacterium]